MMREPIGSRVQLTVSERLVFVRSLPSQPGSRDTCSSTGSSWIHLSFGYSAAVAFHSINAKLMITLRSETEEASQPVGSHQQPSPDSTLFRYPDQRSIVSRSNNAVRIVQSPYNLSTGILVRLASDRTRLPEMSPASPACLQARKIRDTNLIGASARQTSPGAPAYAAASQGCTHRLGQGPLPAQTGRSGYRWASNAVVPNPPALPTIAPRSGNQMGVSQRASVLMKRRIRPSISNRLIGAPGVPITTSS